MSQSETKKTRAPAPPNLPPLSPQLGLSASITQTARDCRCCVCWASGLEHNPGHKETKSEELLLVQEGGLTPSRRALVPRISPPLAAARGVQFPVSQQGHFNGI